MRIYSPLLNGRVVENSWISNLLSLLPASFIRKIKNSPASWFCNAIERVKCDFGLQDPEWFINTLKRLRKLILIHQDIKIRYSHVLNRPILFVNLKLILDINLQLGKSAILLLSWLELISNGSLNTFTRAILIQYIWYLHKCSCAVPLGLEQ